jgi:D-3-phosphoglycerate dehydrogenase / 2-oxoglutarate reductase
MPTMSRPKVVVAEAIAEAGIELLRESCDVDVAIGVDAAELRRRVADAAGLIVRSATTVDRALIEAAPHLAVVGRAGIGVDNIDVDAATEHGVLVVNAPNANTIAAAEHTMALLLAQARRIPQADATLRSGTWDRKSFEGIELHDKILGILGLGKIGTLVAQRASAFGMRIIGYDPYVAAERAKRLGVDMVDLDTLLGSADFITIHLPRTRETEGILDEAAIAKMRDGVRIVNVARGGIVDEEALAAAVRSGKVAGAAVDVFAEEPTTTSPLIGLSEVVVTPHLGASTREAQDKAGVSVAESVAQALRGELVLSAVNLDLGPAVSDDVRPYLPLAEQLGVIFCTFARGLPAELTVCAQGRLADEPVRPLALAVLRGALGVVTDTPVSYVNAPVIAERRGVSIVEEAQHEVSDFQSVLRISGVVAGRRRTVAGTFMERKGPVLIDVDGYEIEVPISEHLLLVRNDDVPGVIGRIGSFLGEQKINIADMVVGRDPAGHAAMMGLALDQDLSDVQVDQLLAIVGINAARYIRLG